MTSASPVRDVPLGPATAQMNLRDLLPVLIKMSDYRLQTAEHPTWPQPANA
ncbi:hypothetical protein [Streptomyces sp. NPDC093984]|uniref:hypothetical protein n=1 Tax=Streptomyces sp. NPDC093984 TaxID=3366052 RepID=UPI003805351A